MAEQNEGVWANRPFVSSAFLIAAGLGLLPGGIDLLFLGGSPYYALSGAALVASGGLLFARSRWGWRLYSVTFVATLVWALWEVGEVSFWPLAPRVLPLVGLGLVFLLPSARAASFSPLTPGQRKIAWGGAGIFVIVVAVTLAAATAPPTAATTTAPAMPTAETAWPYYGNGQGGTRYADIGQINRDNIGNLEVAWVHRSGDMPHPHEMPPIIFSYEATPLKIDNTLYLCTAHNIVMAVNALTGEEMWRFDPKVDTKAVINAMACRGVAYAAPSEAAETACPRRIFATAMDSRLFAINADTGELCTGWGENGTVSLNEHLGDYPDLHNYVTSPPAVAAGNVIVGGLVTDSQPNDVASGVIRAYDAVTGTMNWAWDMGVPDRIGPPEEGEIFTVNTPNSWAPLSVDESLGLVYVPLGNPSPDYFGGNRWPFDEKYGTAVVALDAETGRAQWSFQTTHHDIWDYDLPSQPVLADLERPALIQATKVGQIFVLDRRDGTPILPVQEVPMPQNAVPGERPSPTQPISALNLLPPPLTEADMWGVTPYDQLWCRVQFKRMRYDGHYTPQSTQSMLQYPGLMGVTEWGGVAVDEKNKILVVNTSTVPYWTMTLAKEDVKDIPSLQRIPATSGPLTLGEIPADGTAQFWVNMQGPYLLTMASFLGPLQVPCNEPPWGHMVAFDLTTGKQLWKHRIGTAQDSGPLFTRTGLALLIGTPNLGGPLVTAGGLVFHSGTLDNYLRAYDINTGEELWRSRLPAGGQATPMTYAGADGRQYVVVAAGGHGGMRTKSGDYLIAYALPNVQQPR